VAAAVLIVVALVAVTVRYLWLPKWRPSLHEGERYGVDVAAHQGRIDWSSVADDDISFAYVKASEGADFTDRRFTSNWRGAHAAGLDRGAYHFFTLCSDGREQAEHFLDIAPPVSGALPPAVDLEIAGNCSAKPSPQHVQTELRRFLQVVEGRWGTRAILYVGDDWDRRYPTRKSFHRPLWHRRIMHRPDIEHWVIWQVQGKAHVDGIKGSVDLDVMRPGVPRT
jgi:lysozyme